MSKFTLEIEAIVNNYNKNGRILYYIIYLYYVIRGKNGQINFNKILLIKIYYIM